MWVDGTTEFDSGGFECLAQHNLGNQIGRVMADDLTANNLAILLAGDDFDEPFGLIHGDCFAVGAERHPPDLDLDTARLGVRFAQPNAGNFWFAIDTGWN